MVAGERGRGGQMGGEEEEERREKDEGKEREGGV